MVEKLKEREHEGREGGEVKTDGALWGLDTSGYVEVQWWAVEYLVMNRRYL